MGTSLEHPGWHGSVAMPENLTHAVTGAFHGGRDRWACEAVQQESSCLHFCTVPSERGGPIMGHT
jgi:hypothetical protein